MSQLRKSASFRSRIPVRRNRIAQRRCCSPQPFFGDASGNLGPACGCAPYYKLRPNRSFAFEGPQPQPHRSNSHHHFHNQRHRQHHHQHQHQHHQHPSSQRTHHSSDRRYSSSSFSSSDESCESEAPHQKFARQSQKIPADNCMYVSTDAISLDGLLDSVSCGSFSSPPSPVHYQNTQEPLCYRSSSYESLEKYNIALESFQISEAGAGAFLPYPLTANVTRLTDRSVPTNCYNNNGGLRNNYSNNKNRDNNREQNITANNKFRTMSSEAGGSSAAATATATTSPPAPTHALMTSRSATGMALGGGLSKEDASKKTFYMEKQKQLSDWYYIKTKKDVVATDDLHDDKANGNGKDNDNDKDKGFENADDASALASASAAASAPSCGSSVPGAGEKRANGGRQEINDGENFVGVQELDESLLLDHNYVNSTRQRQQQQHRERQRQQQQQHATAAINSSQPTFASLTRKTVLGSARYAAAAPPEPGAGGSEARQQPIKWNNFAQLQQQQQQQPQHGGSNVACDGRARLNGGGSDDGPQQHQRDNKVELEGEYVEAVDALCRGGGGVGGGGCREKPLCPPYYCPPTYAAAQQPGADHVGLSSVNVRLLKQHYQQQQQQQQFGAAAEYANMSFRRRGEPGRRNKNKIELQLEHWENIGNGHSGAGGVGAADTGPNKCQRTAMDGGGHRHVTPLSPEDECPTMPPRSQQQQQQQKLNRGNCYFNNSSSAATATAANGNNNNIRASSSSDNLNKQHNNRSNSLNQQQQHHQFQLQAQPQSPQQQQQMLKETHQQLQSPPEGGVASPSSPKTRQQHLPFMQHHQQQQQQQQHDACGSQPAAAPRRLLFPPPTATPRTALRSRLVQKRSDETSCSSFEQLNIVGIPTGDAPDEDGYGYDHDQDDDQEDDRELDLGFEHEFRGDSGGDVPGGSSRMLPHCYGLNDKIDAGADPASASPPSASPILRPGDERCDRPNPASCVLGIYENQERRLASLGAGVGVGVGDAGPAEVGQEAGRKQQPRQEHPTAIDSSSRPLPDIPRQSQQQHQQPSQIQLQLQQNPQTRQLFGVVDSEMFPPKTTPSCRSDCELSGSYASLECPSPPGPPVCLPESRRDPQARLGTYLRTFYTDLSLKEPIIPQWAIPVAPGALCAARLEPDLRLNANSHGFSDSLTVDQILVSLQTKEGSFLEAPRRCLIECPAWASRSNLCLRILHAWAKEPPWPTKGTPVALALFIPLPEVKRSFANYVEKELLPKGPLNPFASGIGGFSAAWNSLESLGPKLLIILDGYDSQKLGNPSAGGGTPKKGKSGGALGVGGGGGSKHHYPTDVHDLLDGRLFPEARVIITTSTPNCPELLPIIQRHITYEGLTWGRSASLLGGGQWGGPSRLLDAIQENVHMRKVVRTPLGCLAITAIYEATGGDLPADELDVVESILNCVAPEASTLHVSELGRLALFCLKMKRASFTLAEMRMYCSSPESALLGCLDKSLLLGKSAKKKCEYVYNPICPGMMELLAANYIASLASRPGLLAAEITGMAVGDELDPDLLKVLKFAMTLLGERAHILLSRLTPLWLTPQIVFTLALAGGHTEDNLAALCDILGISKHPPISPLETKPLWVQVRSVPTDLMGWGMALKSPTCTLKNLEVIYQLEKHNLLESRKAIEIFLDSMVSNESVSTLRLSSLIEMDVKDSEISYLANCVAKLLLKPRLENFELVLTLLEEDPPILKLQSVVAALCRTIPRQPRLSFLLLDLTLSTSQLVQLCATLEKCPNVTRLSLPHLRCERGAITALASLLNSRPISFLSLPSCWGARDDPPSSSGVSMGSGSGSSTGTSGLIKQGSLPGVPSPRSYAPGIFSSLPRGVFVPQSSLGRSATLPRQPLEQSLDKRSCDSVVSKTWYPTPACDGGPHNSGTLHDLLLAARESYSKLHGLDLSKAQLSLEDSMCLGETVRLSNTLHTLKLEGSSRLSEILPSVLGASESSCLQMLSIGSPRLSLEDSAIAMCARALTSCSTLRLLSLDGWSFRIENTSTLSIMRAFLSLTSIRELSLANCRLQIGLIRSETKVSHAFESRSVVVLKLAGAQATLADANIMRGPQLLQYIGGFPCLRELDLSAPARSGLGSAHTTPLILDDKCMINFFQHLHSHFGLLNTLKICHWVVHFDEMAKTLKTIAKCIRNSPISHLKMDGISVLDRPKKQRSEANLVHCFISSLPQLRWMGISLAGKKEDHISAIGNAVLDLKGYEIDIKLSESTIEQAKLMAQAISLDGKFDIKVSTFGTSSGILVHAEKSGTKSLTRKNKD